MKEFILYRDGRHYTLKVNGRVLIEDDFKSPTLAIPHFRHFVSSWAGATLLIDESVQELPSIEKHKDGGHESIS